MHRMKSAAVAAALASAGVSWAAPTKDVEAKLAAMEKELQAVTAANVEFQRRQEILTEEIRKVREKMVLPEEPKFKSAFGLGPAASKVYGIQRGLSIGGYGQAFYTNLIADQGPNDHSTFDFLRAIIYAGYKFSDKLVFNSETEYEHANTGKGGVVSVEFATLDYLANPAYNFRMGLLLLPIGFINEIHEPNFYHGNERPEVERQIIPTTWRENGIGMFGAIDKWSYKLYLVNSGRASQLRSANLRGFRQDGALAFADDWAVALRTDYAFSNQLVVGGSMYSGDQGQREDFTLRNGQRVRPAATITLTEAHAQYRNRGLEFRALATQAHIGDHDVLSDAEARAGRTPISEEVFGWYAEVAFDVMTLMRNPSNVYVAPFFRFEKFDTQARVPLRFAPDDTRDVLLRTFGVDYKPHPQVVLKIDHRDFSLGRGTRADELNIGFGYIF